MADALSKTRGRFGHRGMSRRGDAKGAEILAGAEKRLPVFLGIDAAAIERLRRSALAYVANHRRFAAGLRRID